jgi:DNA-binding transcriptional regulator YiaG
MRQTRSFFFPVYVPKVEVQHAEEVYEKTAKAAEKFGWWKNKDCACGCGLTTQKTYVKGHNNERTARLARDKIARASKRLIPAAELKEARRMAGFTHRLLAKRLGCSRRVIGYWEDGRRIPTPAQERMLMQILPALRR